MTTRLTGVWRAKFETPNFLFEAFGLCREHAWAVLKKGWEEHAKHTGAEPDYLEQYAEDVYFDTITTGVCQRDGIEYWKEE